MNKVELESLGKIVNAFLDLAEDRAQRNIPMTMEDWAKRIDAFLEFDEREILQDGGKISTQIAKAKNIIAKVSYYGYIHIFLG